MDADEIRQTVAEAVSAKRLAALPAESPGTILRRLSLLVNGRPTQAAIVLFGKDPMPQYPPEALREALVNAFCQRDYSEAGASIGVSVFDDRLEVWSWGRLPGDLTPEKLRADHPSVRRNDLVADVFYRRGYIEKWGRGTQKIIKACRRAGLREAGFIARAGEVGVRFWAAATAATVVGDTELSSWQREVLNVVGSLGEPGVEEIRQALQAPPTGRMVQTSPNEDLQAISRALDGIWNALWTFTRHSGVEPTNNSAEREGRPAVTLRKTSLGSQSERGSRFVERFLTAVQTLKKSGRKTFDYIVEVVSAALDGKAAPSFLLPIPDC